MSSNTAYVIPASSATMAPLTTTASPAPILLHLSPASLRQVSALATQHISVETPYFFPIAFITLLFILYFLASLLHNFILPFTLRRQWPCIKPEHRRTMVIYILQILITTLALISQLVVLPLLNLSFTLWRLNLLRSSACLISALYLFELIYRYRMTYPMISHHLITCFAMSLSFVMLERLQDPSFALTGLLWIFQATTEQTVFLSLFLYRLSVPVKVLKPLFKVSAVQSLLFKFASIGGTVWVWIKYQRKGDAELERAWDGLFWICTIGLGLTQVWGAWVVWKMGESLEKRYAMKMEESEVAQLKGFAPVLAASSGSTTTESSRTPSSQFSAMDLEKAEFKVSA